MTKQQPWKNNYIRICKSKIYDDFFANTKTSDVKPSYLEKFEGIREQYLRLGYMSPAQVQVLEYAIKKKRPSGISAGSFRGLPRTVHEGIY